MAEKVDAGQSLTPIVGNVYRRHWLTGRYCACT
jgi:hypothetical protein